jgi:hypothetical protein
MDGTAGSSGVAAHFGRELRRTRVARGWSIAEVARRTKINAGHLSRSGWFSAWHGESQSWPEIPATFRSWPDYEDRSATVRAWTPSIMTGLTQSEAYAAALIATTPAADTVTRDTRPDGAPAALLGPRPPCGCVLRG